MPRLPAVIRRCCLHVVAEPHDDRHRPLHPGAAPDGEADDGVDGARSGRRHRRVRHHHRRAHRHVLPLRRHRRRSTQPPPALLHRDVAERARPPHLQHRHAHLAVRPAARPHRRPLLPHPRPAAREGEEDEEPEDEDDEDAHRRRHGVRDRVDAVPRVRHHIRVRRRRRQGQVLQVRRRHHALLRHELVVHQPAAVRVDERQLPHRLPRHHPAAARGAGPHQGRRGLGERHDGDAGVTQDQPGAAVVVGCRRVDVGQARVL